MIKEQVYRASIGAIILDKDYNFLLVRLKGEPTNKRDFVKGGMNVGETEIQTLEREIFEEIGDKINYKIIKKSSWYFVYNWPEKLQKERGYRGQIRQNYWVNYTSGEIILNPNELIEYKWVSKNNITDCLKICGFPDIEINRFLDDFNKFKLS